MNTTGSEHIVRAYDEELEQLTNMISQMGGLAESQFDAAMQAIEKRDDDLAMRTREKDKEIDQLEHDIEVLAVRMIATRQPMANDLRYIISCLKTSSDIERLGDYAKNMAKRAIVLNQVPTMQTTRSVLRMGRLVQKMINDVFDAFLAGDKDKAINVWESDEEVDNHYTSLFRELLTYMMEDPRNITPCTHLLFIAKNIERMGDLTTNIAESIYFRVEGKVLADNRPKADASNYTLLDPDDDQN